MEIRWLELRDVRSYHSLDFRPDEGINVLIGANGAGKTTVLEAIGYLSSLKSFRGAPDAAILRDGAEEAVLRAGFFRDPSEVKVEVALPSQGRRRVLFNGKRPARYGDVAAEIPVVAFLPDDLDLVKRSPGLRRDYLDDLAARLSPAAGADQDEYDKALRQRNSLLKRSGHHVDGLTLEVWDQRIAEAGARVVEHRLALLDRLGPMLRDAYARTSGIDEPVAWEYVASWGGVLLGVEDGVRHEYEGSQFDSHRNTLLEALAWRRERDMDQRTTTTGPHRDDPSLTLEGRPVRTHASQGEQRSVALSLRLAAYRLLEERHRRPPILLLDDVFSELDPMRSHAVMELLPRGQVFVTSAREDEVPVAGTRWTVGDGTVVIASEARRHSDQDVVPAEESEGDSSARAGDGTNGTDGADEETDGWRNDT